MSLKVGPRKSKWSQNWHLCTFGPSGTHIFLTQPHFPSKSQSNPCMSLPIALWIYLTLVYYVMSLKVGPR